ncbi:tol-pal system protein YbgF [Chitinimonas koreensis]|uniref:tol-pal system protein YbgF n=1 Tax=Chitinimonas koreensis TaxID=356302 RepID=UPI000414B361|nr:tol-pal system protein YbgF [Chitinimonas koreensis]QNM96556.1 tol-pal system protein YbgF [Chitinimonas koreensis]
MPNRLLPLALAALVLPAHAGLFDDDEARKQIAEIRQNHEQRLVDQNSRLEQLDNRTGQKLVEISGQIGELTQQIAQLRGQLEVAAFNLQNLQKRQQDLYVDLDTRLRAVEEGKPRGQTPTAQAQAAQLEAEAATAYEGAYNLYREGKLKGAIDALSAIGTRYAGTQAAPNALFWLGMAQAQAGDAKAAPLSWRKLVDEYPDHAKSPDALRAIASLQLEKGDKKGAAKTLREVVSAYPGSDAAKEAEKQLKKL